MLRPRRLTTWSATGKTPTRSGSVHFRDDGTYVEDYQGVEDFRVGEYSLDGSTVKLEGDDGNTDEGTVEGETLVFKLGTLERAEP